MVVQFRGSMAGLHVPLSTLHPRRHRRKCMTRSQCGALLLHCMKLSFTTPCRLLPAHRNHEPQPSETYLCLDGKSQVCARCCVEQCAVDTPAWFDKCAEAGHPTWPAVKTRRTVAAKLVCLESYWNRELFKAISVKGFFESLATLIRPRLQLAHRFVESERGLAYYTQHPEGLLWKLPESWDTPIYYLAFHGEPGAVKSVLDRIGAETLLEAFR